jgi:hypothetical protein
VSGDAQKFLMIKVVERPDQRPSAPPSVVIVLNAFEELNAKVPGQK